MRYNLGNHLKGREEVKSVSEPCPSYQPPSPFPKIPVSVSISDSVSVSLSVSLPKSGVYCGHVQLSEGISF